jgi:regulatory protein
MVTVTEYKPAEARGKLSLRFDNGFTLFLYRSEARRFHLAQDAALTDEDFTRLLDEVVTKRAKKRALHLLEQMDRTEHQLRQKLARGGYPEVCIDTAIDYVKSYHYLDDHRYACTFIRYSRDRMSRLRMKQKLMERGISRDLIDRALEEACEDSENDDSAGSRERAQIIRLLEKRHYVAGESDEATFRRTYQYLLRRGYSSTDVLREMRLH